LGSSGVIKKTKRSEQLTSAAPAEPAATPVAIPVAVCHYATPKVSALLRREIRKRSNRSKAQLEQGKKT